MTSVCRLSKKYDKNYQRNGLVHTSLSDRIQFADFSYKITSIKHSYLTHIKCNSRNEKKFLSGIDYDDNDDVYIKGLHHVLNATDMTWIIFPCIIFHNIYGLGCAVSLIIKEFFSVFLLQAEFFFPSN